MATSSYNLKDISSTPAEEAYRVLRTNIQFCGFDNRIKTLTITSCNPGDGKTTTCINLGISMAKSGMKVLVVDADLRKPMLLKHLGANSHIGLSNIISGTASIDDAIITTNMENFYYLPCGPKPPNPTELIGSSRFKQFLQSAEGMFDMVIVDTPPLGSVIDCAIVAAQTDASIIVIAENSVEYGSALRVKEQLEKANAKVLGVVLNKVGKSSYKKYYNYYNYHTDTTKKISKGWFKKYKRQRVE